MPISSYKGHTYRSYTTSISSYSSYKPIVSKFLFTLFHHLGWQHNFDRVTQHSDRLYRKVHEVIQASNELLQGRGMKKTINHVSEGQYLGGGSSSPVRTPPWSKHGSCAPYVNCVFQVLLTGVPCNSG